MKFIKKVLRALLKALTAIILVALMAVSMILLIQAKDTYGVYIK